jgi:putative DNA-invertase from lambdoid prophage Rac
MNSRDMFEEKQQVKKVAIYTRVSTGKQDWENQLRILKEYAAKMEWEVVAIYSETISGKEADRPEFKIMMQRAQKREFDAILVWALDRFTREGTGKVWHYITELNNWKVKFISYQEPYFNTDNEMVRDVLFSIMGALAKQERIKISERTKAGLAMARKRGAIFGRPDVKHKCNTKIIDLYKQGVSMRHIAQQVTYNDHNNNQKNISLASVHKVITEYKNQEEEKNIEGEV